MTRNSFQLPLLNALTLGLIMGALFLYAGFQHNPQGVFWEPGVVHFRPTAVLFLSGAIPVAAIVFAVEFATHSVAQCSLYAKTWSKYLNNDFDLKHIMRRILRSLWLPAVDAILLGLLLAVWSGYLAGDFRDLNFMVGATAIGAAVVFIVELIVQQIVRTVTAPDLGAKM